MMDMSEEARAERRAIMDEEAAAALADIAARVEGRAEDERLRRRALSALPAPIGDLVSSIPLSREEHIALGTLRLLRERGVIE